MLPYFWYILKVIICSGILFGYYWLFLRNKIFHQYNRFYLLSAIILSLLLPLVKIGFWQQNDTPQASVIKVLQAVSAGDEYMSNVVITANKSGWSFQQLYPLLYWMISVVFFFMLVKTLFAIRSLLKRYPVQEIEKVSFVNTNDKSTPFSFFKYIFWNAGIDMNTHTGKQIFKHEVAHIQEKHTHDKLFVNMLLIFFWCNPFFWLYRKELNMIHEFIADRKAVEDSDTASLAAMILRATYPQHRFELTNNFFYSPIKRRLLMLTKNNHPRVSYFARIMVLPLAVLIFAAFTFKTKNIKDNFSVTSETKQITENIVAPATGTSVIEEQKKSPKIKDTVPVNAPFIDVEKALIIFNGKILGKGKTNVKQKHSQLFTKSLQVIFLKKAEATAKYGKAGADGACELSYTEGISVTSASVDADNMIVFYIGIENPLTIVSNNVGHKDMVATISLGAMTGGYNGKYIVFEQTVGEGTIRILKNDGITILGTFRFRVKRLPDPTDPNFPSELKYKYKLDSSRISELKQKYILEQQNLATPKLYFGDVTGSISEVEFFKKQKEMRISGGYKFLSAVVYFTTKGHTDVVVLDGNSLSPIRGYLDRCESGSVITFDNIRVSDPNGQVRGIEGISYSLYSVNEVSGIAPAKLDYAEKQLLAKNADAALEKAIVERKLNDQELYNLKQKLLLEQQNIAKSDYTEKAILYEKELPVQQSNLVFAKVEVSPMFTGGDDAWRKYLEKNLDSGVPLNEGWKAGKYTVMVKFIVRMDGTVSDVVTENYKGTRTARHCIGIIKQAPKWQPAIQNGKKVNAYKKQPITFVIEE